MAYCDSNKTCFSFQSDCCWQGFSQTSTQSSSFNHWVTYLIVKVSLNNPQSALTAVFIGAPFYSWSALKKKHFLKSTQRTDRRCIWKQTLLFHCCPQWRWVSLQTNCGFCFLRTFKCFLNVWCFISLENLYHAQLKLAVCQVQRVKWSQIYYIHISLELSKYVHD